MLNIYFFLYNSNIIITFATDKQIKQKIMRQIETKGGYLVVERIGGLDVYMDDNLVCELSGKTLSSYSYDDKIDTDKLDDDISEELGTLEVLGKVSDPFNVL